MAKPPLGSGERFRQVEASARAGGARNPKAVAAAVGRKKYGAKKMAALSAAGRKRKSRSRKGPTTTTIYQGGDRYESR